NQFLKITSNSFLSHDFEHLLTDLTDLSSLSISGLLDLVTTTRSEGDSEETNKITIGSLDINESLNQRLPLLDHGTEVVGVHINTEEVCETDLALDIVNLQLDLTEITRLVLGEITERHLDDTTLEGVVGVTETLST